MIGGVPAKYLVQAIVAIGAVAAVLFPYNRSEIQNARQLMADVEILSDSTNE